MALLGLLGQCDELNPLRSPPSRIPVRTFSRWVRSLPRLHGDEEKVERVLDTPESKTVIEKASLIWQSDKKIQDKP